jgi:hypothetical protein
MAVVTRRTSPVPALSTSAPSGGERVGSGLICGEDIAAGAPCFIASDGLVYMSGGSGVNSIDDAGAAVHGWAPIAAKVAQGDAITLLTNVDFGYAASGLTPGTPYYIDVTEATKGRINTVQTIEGCPPCAFALDATRIRVLQSLPFVTPDEVAAP